MPAEPVGHVRNGPPLPMLRPGVPPMTSTRTASWTASSAVRLTRASVLLPLIIPPQTRSTGTSLAENAGTTKDSRATNIRDLVRSEREKERRSQLRRVAPAYRGEDSLANLTNLELIARQWRTSAMLRKIWRSSERASSRKPIHLDHPVTD
ncbi:hypothetical protein MRX96_014246 [Rhipicephalus microplus]